MSGDVWFAVLPDGERGMAAARLLRPWGTETIPHHSGRPWLLGSWPPGHMTVGAAGDRRIAVIGRCPVTVAALSECAGRLRDIGDVERIAHSLHGSFHLLASVDGSVRARGSVSGARRLFHTRVAGVSVAADRADRLAAVIGSAPDEQLLAAHLLASPLPYPLDDLCVWQGVQAVPSFDCLLIDADGRARMQPWWTPPEPHRAWREGVPAVRSALTAAVDARTAGGGTVSADLSGGLDSTSLCFLAARQQARTRSTGAKLVTLRWQSIDPENDDAAWAARAAAHLPDSEHITPAPDQWPSWYSALTALTGDAVPTDEPGPWVRDGARMTALCRLMTDRGSRSHLMGGGGDELFSTFPPYLHDYVRRHPLAAYSRIRRQRAAHNWPLGQLLRQLADRGTFGHWLSAWAESLTGAPPPSKALVRSAPSTAWGVGLRMPTWATREAVEAVRDLLREAAATAEPLAAERGQHTALACVRTGGRGLRQLDQVTSRNGLALTAPYLDDQVIEAALAIRVAERSTPGRYKPVLAEAVRGIVPDDVLRRNTKGEYSTDFHVSLRRNLPALLELFDGSRLARAGLIDDGAIRASLLGVHPTPEALRSLGSTLGNEIWLRARPAPTGPPSTTITEGVP
ncbi:asparagine synthase-related protein [Streptomyces sp. NPDC015345]|uniref:asparagine synthase-related protein n=1 Tax=Streptomyces sp. NPDC015345 TaxID=3364953 RepID=UPI0036F5ECDA